MSDLAKFIVLEGLDGVGKTTLVSGLAEFYGGVFMNTPGEMFANIRSTVLTALEEDQLGRALFYAATVSAQGCKARQILNSGQSVIMDRYWASTIAYAKARGVTANLDPLAPEFECPDVVVLITLDEQHRRIRLRKRGMTDEDYETLDSSFNQRVMRELTSRCSVQVDVSGLDERDAVLRVADAVEKYIKEYPSCCEAP